jgi:hypothetical protein
MRSAPRRRRWRRIVLAAVLFAAVVFAIPRTRVATLGALGGALVASDPVTAADAIVVSVDAGAAGVLEAADLVRDGVSNTVAVFSEPPMPADLEFERRGVRHYGDAARALEELAALGVKNAVRIPTPVDGTTAEGRVLSDWVRERGYRTIVMVTTTDHSRRTRRVLRRALDDRDTNVVVRPSRYSDFDARSWWHNRAGVRTALVELQKLLLDVVSHPLS